MSALNPPQFDPFADYTPDNNKYHQGLDFFSFHQPSDILRPHPDLFESDLDLNLAAFDEVQLQLLTIDQNDAYSYLRSDTPTCGPPSTFTVSSDSAYDSYDSHSSHSELESFYNYPASDYHSEPYEPSSFNVHLSLEAMGIHKVHGNGIHNPLDFAAVTAQQPTATGLAAAHDPASFGILPGPAAADGAYSGYDTAGASDSPGSDYYSGNFRATVNPNNTMSMTGPHHPSLQTKQEAMDESTGDPRKKYQCTNCPRAFARAYNLKTHMATHDPNRLKPHICPHRSCSRSFSRRHDLGRHLISIHRDEMQAAQQLHLRPASPTKKGAVGVERGTRTWCEGCGKKLVGGDTCDECAQEIK